MDDLNNVAGLNKVAGLQNVDGLHYVVGPRSVAGLHNMTNHYDDSARGYGFCSTQSLVPECVTDFDCEHKDNRVLKLLILAYRLI